MVFTERKKRNKNIYSYRILSIRDNNKISKKRIYLGKNLSNKELVLKEINADNELYSLKRKRKGDFDKMKKKIVLILREKGIKKAGIFGSYARGEQKKNSDVDILIEPSKKVLGFSFYDLKEELSKSLNKKLDLITYKGINPLLKEKILNQEVKII